MCVYVWEKNQNNTHNCVAGVVLGVGSRCETGCEIRGSILIINIVSIYIRENLTKDLHLNRYVKTVNEILSVWCRTSFVYA